MPLNKETKPKILPRCLEHFTCVSLVVLDVFLRCYPTPHVSNNISLVYILLHFLKCLQHSPLLSHISPGFLSSLVFLSLTQILLPIYLFVSKPSSIISNIFPLFSFLSNIHPLFPTFSSFLHQFFSIVTNMLPPFTPLSQTFPLLSQHFPSVVSNIPPVSFIVSNIPLLSTIPSRRFLFELQHPPTVVFNISPVVSNIPARFLRSSQYSPAVTYVVSNIFSSFPSLSPIFLSCLQHFPPPHQLSPTLPSRPPVVSNTSLPPTSCLQHFPPPTSCLQHFPPPPPRE